VLFETLRVSLELTQLLLQRVDLLQLILDHLGLLSDFVLTLLYICIELLLQLLKFLQGLIQAGYCLKLLLDDVLFLVGLRR